MDWVENGLKGIDLSDKQLDNRAAKLLKRLVDRPDFSLPGANQGWEETQAEYRFLSNDNIRCEQILHPHWDSTEERIKKQDSVVLCLQDTTELLVEEKNPPKDQTAAKRNC